MTETLAALLFAHVLADFVLQSKAMAGSKTRAAPLGLHGLIVFLTAYLALGLPSAAGLGALALLTALHMGIDVAKALWTAHLAETPKVEQASDHIPEQAGGAASGQLGAFLADQGAHLLTLVAFAGLLPGVWAAGIWREQDWLPPALVLVAGLIVATRAGGFAIGLLMARFDTVKLPRGLPEGGRLIGLLERGLIYLLILAGQPGGVGFLIAAKSVLRFDATSKNQRAGEYVIIGTLASFGWAIASGYATLWLLARLAPIGIGLSPP